jgi:hypothetical protein
MSDVPDRRDDVSVAARESTTGPSATAPATSTERPLTADEKHEVKVASAPAAAGAGAVAGATAGLATGVFGPFGAIVGAIVGALGGAAAGGAHAGAADDLYTAENDAYYESLWETTPDRPADQPYDSARPAYQYGHIAARHPEYAGRDFAAVEPELRRRWPEQLRSAAGEWDASRGFVETGYTHSREQWLAARRDASVVGSGGSAVNPDELARARKGLPSVEGVPETAWTPGP